MKVTRTMRYAVVAVMAIVAILSIRGILRHVRTTRTSQNAGTPVAVMPVILSNVEAIVSATGDVLPWQEVDISPEVTAKIIDIMVIEGTVITAGQVLATLDDDTARATCEAAVAGHKAAEAEVALAVASLENALSTFKRVKNLRDSKVVGQQEYENSETQLKLAVSRKNVALAQLTRLKAQVDELAVRLQYYRIDAPFSGVVSERYLDPGALATPITPIVHLVQTKPIYVRSDLPEPDAESVREGTPARIRTWTLNGTVVTGVVRRVFPALDERWRTRSIEIEVPNTDGLLRPGMFARVTLITGVENALLVPEVAVIHLPGSGISHLYVVRTNIAQRVDVTVKRSLDAWLSVQGSIAPGDDVVVKGQMRLHSGSPVTITRTEMLP